MAQALGMAGHFPSPLNPTPLRIQPCSAAMNQHSSAEGGGDLGDLMTNLESSVSGTAGTIVVMDETGGPLVRVW